MSHDKNHITYWRATQRPDGSKPFAFRFDIWEVDLPTGKEQLFAGAYQFFDGGQLQYLQDDQKLLVNGDSPTSDEMPGRTQSNFSNWHTAYLKK